MPRNVSGVFSLVPGTDAIQNQVIKSADYNARMDDIAADLNAARPITAGGTGAVSAVQALLNLGAQAALGFTPIQQGGGAGQLPNKTYIGWSGTSLKAQIDATDLGKLWTDSIAPMTFVGANSILQTLPSGWIAQAGVMASGATDRSIIYPLAFPNFAFPAVTAFSGSTAAASWATSYVVSYNNAGVTVANRTGGGAGISAGNFWIAVGR